MVLVAGGGIAGLAFALALERRGIPCRVFEAAREMRELGVGITLLPHAMRELAALGLDQLRLVGCEVTLGLLDLGDVGRGIDLEQQIALLDDGAILIADLDEKALDAGDEVDGVESLRIAGLLGEGNQRLLERHRYRDVGRRRRDELVLRLAAGQ